MKLFGSIKELVSAVFRKDTYEITLRPNQSTTYTAARDVQLPAKDGNAVLVSSGDIVNADINASAAIAYSKLALSNSIVNADVAAGAAVAYSKLNLSGSIVNADISNTAAIDAAKIGTGVVSNTEFGYLDGVTSAIQTQLNGKQATITGAATTITSSDLSASKALQSDASGKVAASSVTSTELGYVSGVTSAIQTQLNNKAAKGANSDITSLSGLTTALSIGQGGTGQTTQQAALTALAGTQVSGQYLRSNGTNTLLSAIQAADVPTLNQNTTGTAANVTGTVAIGNGGTGQTTANAALNALLPSQASAANKYLKSDGTNTSWASAAGGAGEINAVLNASGADGTTGWTGTSVVTGSNSPLNPIVTTAFSISNAATTESSTSGGYYPFTLPTGLMNRKLKVEFSYTTPATDVYKVSVYKGSTRVALSTDSSGSTSLPASVTGGKFVAYFDTDNSSSWTVSVTRTSGTTGPAYITNVIVGPGIQPQGAVVGAPIAYTPSTDGFGTVTGITASYTRRGNYIKIQGRFTTGTVNANIAYVSLLNNLNVDTSAISANIIVGKWWRNIATAGVRKTGGLATDIGVNTNIVRFVNDDYTTGVAPGTTLAGNAVAGTGEVIWFDFELPIAEWAGSGTVQLAQNDVEYASNSAAVGGTGSNDTTSFVYGPNGSTIGSITATLNRTVQFQTPIQVGDVLTLQVKNSAAGSQWVDVASAADGGIPVGLQYQNAAVYGLGIFSTSSTQAVVRFGQYAYNTSTYGAAGTTWATDRGTWSWRVRKASAGAAVGFGIVSGSSAGLLPSSNSNLDDATATRLGLKQYLHGTTYNGGIAPTVTLGAGGGTLSSVDLASFVPYQTQDGSWRLKFNIAVTVSSTARTLAALDVVGISVGTLQAVYGLSSSSPLLATSYVSGARFQIDHASSTTTKYYFSGEAALSSKPTWAY